MGRKIKIKAAFVDHIFRVLNDLGVHSISTQKLLFVNKGFGISTVIIF